MPTIHPTAVISPGAVLGRDVAIGPFSVIEDDVRIGDACQFASHVVIKSGTTIGASNCFAERVILGGLPQHIHAPENPGRLVIGERNDIREHVTVHRALNSADATIIGAHNLIMVSAHVGHDCIIGDHTILVNNVMLAGHVEIQDHAYLSGATAVHQFCRIGCYAMVGGLARVRHDVPPHVTIDGETTKAVGLNLVGLRRNGFSRWEISQLKEAYRTVYRRGLTWDEICTKLRTEHSTGPAAGLYNFLATSSRGIIGERRGGTPPTLTLHAGEETKQPASLVRKAG